MKYVNISRKDLENTLPIIATILGFMLDKRESEMAEIDTTVKSIAFSSDVSESDIMTLATIENRLTEVKFELMGIQALAKEVENTYYGLLFETKVYELNLPERTKSTLYRGGCSTMGQLVSLTPTQLKKIRNLGKKTYKDIVDMLKEYGLRLKDEDDVPTADHATSSVSVSLKAVDKNNLKAAGQITLDGCFVVRDVKVLTGSENKPFVSMPSYQTQTGDYAQYALPITKEFHEKLEKAVIGNYHSLGKTEYKGVKYAELGDKNDIAHLPKQNNRFAASLMAELDKAGIKYQARVEDMTSISVHKSDMPRVTDIKNELVKTLNPEKQTNSAPKHKR